MQHTSFGDLLTNRQGWIECCCCALRQISNPLAPQTSQLIRTHGDDVFAFKAHLTADKFQTGLGITERR